MNHLQPIALWHQFEEICSIPHPSGKLDAIRSYVVATARKHGYLAEIDKAGNVKVEIPASMGRENEVGVILQAHLDMVPQANADTSFNFETDGLKLRVVNDDAEYPGKELVMATGTTLGADNGIGIAAMLAIMEDRTISHAPLELLFTADEEVGMGGVRGIRNNWLKGRYLLNLDTEIEGKVMVGCAGAVDLIASMRYKTDVEVPEGDVAIALTLNGLQGGHSGMDIHLGRGNACKLMVRFLKHVVVAYEARLSSLNGGSLRNAIPREATAVITVPAEVVDELLEEVAYYNEVYRYELRVSDPAVTLKASLCDKPSSLLPEVVQDDLLNSLEAIHDGVYRMNPEMPDVVETSSNLAAVHTSADGCATAILLIRSLNDESKLALASCLQSCFVLGGMRVDFKAPYSGWELPLNSQLLAKAKALYKDLFGSDLKVGSVHCGLECGILSAVYPKLDIISFGPTIHHPHSPQESVEVESVEKFYQFVTKLL